MTLKEQSAKTSSYNHRYWYLCYNTLSNLFTLLNNGHCICHGMGVAAFSLDFQAAVLSLIPKVYVICDYGGI